MRKYSIKIMLLGGLIISIFATTPVLAAGHGYGGHGGYGRSYGGWGLGFGIATGVLIGSELAYPYYYPYAYPYAYAPLVLPSESYIVQPQVHVAPPAPTNVWYYCESTKGYYPYTPSCAEGWKTVPASPPAR